MNRKLLFVLALAAVVALLPTQTHAQQPIVITGPFTGITTTILPSRLQPGANVPIPGTGQVWSDPFSGAGGTRYLGVDGQWHGTTAFNDPVTGRSQVVYYSARVPNRGGGSPATTSAAPRAARAIASLIAPRPATATAADLPLSRKGAQGLDGGSPPSGPCPLARRASGGLPRRQPQAPNMISHA